MKITLEIADKIQERAEKADADFAELEARESLFWDLVKFEYIVG